MSAGYKANGDCVCAVAQRSWSYEWFEQWCVLVITLENFKVSLLKLFHITKIYFFSYNIQVF